MWLSGVFLFCAIVQMYHDKIIRMYIHNINGIDLYKRFMIIPILFYAQALSATNNIVLFCIEADFFYISKIKFDYTIEKR